MTDEDRITIEQTMVTIAAAWANQWYRVQKRKPVSADVLNDAIKRCCLGENLVRVLDDASEAIQVGSLDVSDRILVDYMAAAGLRAAEEVAAPVEGEEAKP